MAANAAQGEKRMNNNYTIYKFTFSDGKIYIGQTSEPVEERWKNGEGYKTQPVYVPITLEGWDNIKKEILHTGLTREQANKLEKYYIHKFNSIENGYNCIKPSANPNIGINVGKTALILIGDDVLDEDKIKCQNYILHTLNGVNGNNIKLLWYFILNDNKNMLLTKEKVTTDLNIHGNRYYAARASLIELKLIEIKEPYLIVKYNYMLEEINKTSN